MRHPFRGRMARCMAFWALAGAALVVSHDFLFLVQLGPGEELVRTLRHAAHDYWGAASVALAVGGAAAAIAFALRIARLRRRATSLGASTAPRRPRGYVRRVTAQWVGLLTVVALGFLIQENLEHLRGHGHVLGVGALAGAEYPLAVPVIALITLAAALLGGAFGEVERALLSAIAERLRRAVLRPPVRVSRPPLRVVSAARSPLAGARAGRAPPRGLVLVT